MKQSRFFFSEKAKFSFEDPLNLESLLSEEETMVG